MTKDEFKSFFKYISAATNDTNPSPEKTQVYFDTLNDIPFDVAMIVARKLVATLENPFLPMPAVIRKMAAEITMPGIPNAAEGYEMVLKAIRQYGSYKESEALESLPQVVREATRAIGWRQLCLSEEPDIVRGQWRKAFESLAERTKIENRTPEKLRELSAQVSQKLIGG